MSRVMGNSADVRKLQELMKKTLSAIEGDISDLEEGKNKIRSGWADQGYDDVETIIKDITRALDSAKDAWPNVDKSLEAYAQFLESTGK